uniref:Deoxyribonuclease II n=1 Tax=Syphacia muris TaxID=451379 RepID=A0A0N5ACN9_9BILA
MMYNDAHPDGKGDSYRGHSKGAVVFDKSSGFWLIHSVPNFPHPESYTYPDSGYNNGQSFLCITFNASAIPILASHFTYTMPSIYNSQLPTELAIEHPMLQDIIAKKSLPRGTSVFQIVQTIQSISGFPFIMLGKHKKFNADLYADLLASHLTCSFFTETWPNGATNFPNTCNTTNKDVYNIDSIKIENVIEFPNTKDHSKWAVAETLECGYVCIGDINRQISQRKRAGGTVCLQNPLIWQLYRSSINEVETCAL